MHKKKKVLRATWMKYGKGSSVEQNWIKPADVVLVTKHQQILSALAKETSRDGTVSLKDRTRGRIFIVYLSGSGSRPPHPTPAPPKDSCPLRPARGPQAQSTTWGGIWGFSFLPVPGICAY